MQRTRARLFHSGLARRVSRRLRNCVLAAALLLATPIQTAAAGIFDVHVHLWNGEESLRTYEEQLKRDNLEVSGIGVMWFGGPNQALTGDPDRIKAGNDGIIALASTNRKLLPIATVHPYDGPAAVAELVRVAAKGVKVLKLHPHTQKFDPADSRVLAVVRKAGQLGVVVLLDNASIIPGDCERLFNLALNATETTFIFAHLGGMNFPFLEHSESGSDRQRSVRRQHLFRYLGDCDHCRRLADPAGVRVDAAQCRDRPRAVRVGLPAVFARAESHRAPPTWPQRKRDGSNCGGKRAAAVPAGGSGPLRTCPSRRRCNAG